MTRSASSHARGGKVIDGTFSGPRRMSANGGLISRSPPHTSILRAAVVDWQQSYILLIKPALGMLRNPKNQTGWRRHLQLAGTRALSDADEGDGHAPTGR